MRKRNILIIIIVSLFLISAIGIILLDKSNYIVKITRPSTYIYDKNGNEIEEIKYGNLLFFNTIKSYYIQSAIDEVLNDVMEKEKISLEDAEKILVTSGYKIYICEDSNIQNELENIYFDERNFNDDGESATIILDNNTSEVMAIIGSRNTKLNNVIDRRVQPSSSLTLLSVYAYGFENNIFTKDSKYVDEPLNYGNWKVINYYGKFMGEMTVTDAIKNSTNTIAVKLSNEIGIENSYKFLQSLGITSLNEYDKNLAAMALGGLSEGVNLHEMSGAYRTVLNDGIYRSSAFYSKILDRKDDIYMENKQTSNQIIKNSVCLTIKESIKVDINGKEAYMKASSNNTRTDFLAFGVADSYTISTWYGYNIDDNRKSNENEAEKLWKLIMNKITNIT